MIFIFIVNTNFELSVQSSLIIISDISSFVGPGGPPALSLSLCCKSADAESPGENQSPSPHPPLTHNNSRVVTTYSTHLVISLPSWSRHVWIQAKKTSPSSSQHAVPNTVEGLLRPGWREQVRLHHPSGAPGCSRQRQQHGVQHQDHQHDDQ